MVEISDRNQSVASLPDTFGVDSQHLDKVVAIKAIYRHLSEDFQFRDRALLEPIAMAKLDHPHIVPVYDFFLLDGISHLVMAYIEGGSLADLLSVVC